MLLSLHIENIAIIKSVDLDFSSGFMVLTGETGAGKSIIIDSINLLLGGRTEREMIRTGESSATVSGLMFTSGWCYGFGSPIFAICAILAVIVMHDATGVRREAGKQATTIKQLTEAINGFITEKDQQVKAEKLKELVGHTPLQVFFGVVIGIIATVLYCLIGGVEYCSLQSIVF